MYYEESKIINYVHNEKQICMAKKELKDYFKTRIDQEEFSNQNQFNSIYIVNPLSDNKKTINFYTDDFSSESLATLISDIFYNLNPNETIKIISYKRCNEYTITAYSYYVEKTLILRNSLDFKYSNANSHFEPYFIETMINMLIYGIENEISEIHIFLKFNSPLYKDVQIDSIDDIIDYFKEHDIYKVNYRFILKGSEQ